MENKISLIDRKDLTISGIKKAVILSETSIALELENSLLQVSGKNMEVKKLDVESGLLVVDGQVDSIKFSSQKEKTGLFKRIFK